MTKTKSGTSLHNMSQLPSISEVIRVDYLSPINLEERKAGLSFPITPSKLQGQFVDPNQKAI